MLLPVLLITEFISETITKLIADGGYGLVFVLMTLESMVAPIPSEAVMPFAGFLIVEGQFTYLGVILFSTLGSIVGSFISYFIGYYLGKPFVLKFGKYLLLDKHHLELTEKFFQKRGDITILICRFIPIVRHLISIPAGVGKMNLIKFSIYTIVGAGIWNTFLTFVGFNLRDNWAVVMKYGTIADLVIIGLLLLGIAFLIYKRVKKNNQKKLVE